jgi:diketogulonate reductase-like aldo/keto reductase
VQVVLRWHLQSGWAAIPKSTNPMHIEQNIDIFDFELTSEEMARIAAMDRDRPMFRIPRWLLGLAARFAPIRDLP